MLLGLLLSSLTSCAVAPPDVPLCAELGPTKGICINTISSKEKIIDEQNKHNDQTWWQMRPYMILMPIDSWVEIKRFIIKVCKSSGKCKNTTITNWERSIGKIDQKIYGAVNE